MKRIVVFLLCLLLAPALMLAEPARQSDIVASTTTRLNLRMGPGVQFPVILTLNPGESVRLDGRSDVAPPWVHGLTSAGQSGWMYGGYLTAAPEQLLALPSAVVADVPAAPVDTGVVAPPAAPPPAPGNYYFVSGVTGNAHAIFARGQQMGNRANVFSKIGDSITAAPHFLNPIGWGAYNLRDYAYLQPVVNYFSAQGVRTANSFANESLAAGNGWTTGTALDPAAANTFVCAPGEMPLVCEYRLSKPAVALILFGSNDVGMLSLDSYRANLARIAQISIDMGVIPVFSTAPYRQGFEGIVPAYNQAVVDTARGYDVPLWDYASALLGLASNGLGDGIHPSYPPGTYPGDIGAAADFTAQNLGYGYTVRNLTALQVLETIWQQALY